MIYIYIYNIYNICITSMLWAGIHGYPTKQTQTQFTISGSFRDGQYLRHLKGGFPRLFRLELQGRL